MDAPRGRRIRALCAALAVQALLGGGAAALADEPAATPPPPPPAVAPAAPPVATVDRGIAGLMYDFLLAARLNPLGVIADFRLRYRTRLYRSDAAALAQNWVGPVFGLVVTPQVVRPGLGVELQPLSILNLYAGYEPILWMGTLGSIHSYPNAGADHGSGVFASSPPYVAGETYAGVTHHVVLGATVRLKVRSIALRNYLRFAWYGMTPRRGDTVLYDGVYDVMVPANGWMVYNETDLAWLSSFGLTVAVRHAVTHSFFPDDALAGQPNLDTPVSRLGPIIAYTFRERPGARFDMPTLVVMANWFLKHRYRTGALVDQAVPMVAIALTFRGQFLEGGKAR